MDTQDQNSAAQNKYPPAYAHIEHKVRDAVEKIRQFDERIQNTPNDRGPDLSYNPPSFMKSRQLGSRDAMISSLEKAKAQLKAETWKEIEHDLKDKKSTLAKQTRDMAREEIYPNIYQSMDETHKKEHQLKGKDIDQSQDFMSAALTNARAKWIDKEQNNLSEKSTDTKQGRDIDESQNRMSAMVAQYKQKNSLDRESVLQKELPVEQNNNVSVSVKFSQSLNYNKTTEKADRNMTPSKDKESPDRD
ncbi:hypothetical protein GCM10011514_30150 [Emticicia aquatilis]|uniref:Uncharacterized protein n=1 Tax=Emticicia aquatilis TaxID=1537369 RepID=A0A916YWN6_9BACT|nr:hypothetical protein [Emticicia aquatilis]GGD64176.1 hypothetical protein GCM10011514_30150 [Emticicia aquatilis]